MRAARLRGREQDLSGLWAFPAVRPPDWLKTAGEEVLQRVVRGARQEQH